ncbi:MAG: hypothetical protein HYV53_01945 [Parcubacteria group bacterium]|nr:hypothetical protein [Parcubacteria group bacterium]
MENKNEMLIDPNLKEKINQEGFEENAAVLIGNKEEMPQMQERLEQEGRAENLGSYIRMHKSITVPKEKIDKHSINESHKGQSTIYWKFDNITLFYFIDKEGNIAEVIIDPTKISSMARAVFKRKDGSNIIDVPTYRKQLETELKELGFKELDGEAHKAMLFAIQEEYENKMKQQKERKENEFDF